MVAGNLDRLYAAGYPAAVVKVVQESPIRPLIAGLLNAVMSEHGECPCDVAEAEPTIKLLAEETDVLLSVVQKLQDEIELLIWTWTILVATAEIREFPPWPR